MKQLFQHYRYIIHIVYVIHCLHSSGSWCTCCSPGDTSHHWEGRCHPVCRHRQSGNRRQWKTPAAESRSSSRFVPGKTKRDLSFIFYTFTRDTDKRRQAATTKHAGKLLQAFLTSQTATCMMASKPPSGESRFPEICCWLTNRLNSSPLFVSFRTFL